MLLYVSEGFLPFLQELYGQAYSNQHSAMQKKQAEGKFTNSIHDALIVSEVVVMNTSRFLVKTMDHPKHIQSGC